MKHELASRALSDMAWLEDFITWPHASLTYDTEAKLFILDVDAIPNAVVKTGKTLKGVIGKMRRELA